MSAARGPDSILCCWGLGRTATRPRCFLGAPALEVEDAWVTWSRPGTLPPPVDRITMTYPVFNAARRVLFLTAGASKARVVRDVLEGPVCRDVLPAAGIRPTEGTVTWIIDEEAARLLARRPGDQETVR